mmetsp:Transcript_11277/g.16485  ORF Transcript_11277/g.16485 Transcript_11277/m.16485 type:complete len:84 (-) Transcript_11277:91-342(-)|eukprot:CAMPEP_0194026096 /NCGR_PEP_ID=MMETSP0009_2-20130614/409_1 /TAXON_ID=210454 /ORGANISM="Grammatophora oceanica, Strain CCMP 410" /LENGTH=83 /DNA_ID=CAMNT_0038664611 /DNA_START=44 /DNA_END=295 /DNA_ORIENTATION=-
MLRSQILRQSERIVNKNPFLYGPGPLARRPGGMGDEPPLKSLIYIASSGVGISLAAGLFYKIFMGDPWIKKINDYYAENYPNA